ncbi:hypothetical protein BDV93DRAFT_496772 [Ceratobasidium sp. AG-I]|nr:hypothetical protein BDV93DRAFT_496772 [Ceratobasidium sp. AG-I]
MQVFVQPRLIYGSSLDELLRNGSSLDIDSIAVPERYRFVECAFLVDQGILGIWEFLHLPSEPYSAVSYVWRGNKVPDKYDVPVFTVRGAEDADPISTELLRHACKAALKRGTHFLWLDRLSIMQMNKHDKNWQISKMYNMYRFCAFCVIIPAGLQRLVSLQEETQWIHRGWTLQEALAPPAVEVMFSWTLGELQAIPGDSNGFRGNITEIFEGQSAMAPLWLVLDACVAGSLSLFEVDAAFSGGRFEHISIFGVGEKGYTGSDFRFALPNVAALAAAVSRSMQEDYDRKCYTIWKCALMRTSSRPVDMVFSIMGLFGVILDPSQFDKNDRVGATIALARNILQKGGRATWLGSCFHVPPFAQVSTFPTFPRTAVAGKALVRVTGGYAEMSRLMDNEYPIAEVLGPMPRGAMDENGYLTFEAKAIQISISPSSSLQLGQSDSRRKCLSATNGTLWEACDDAVLSPELISSNGQPKAFAVLLGCFFGYHPSMTPAYDCNNVRGLIILEHAAGKFHVSSYFMLSIRTIDWAVSWSLHKFCVGGPDSITSTYLDEPLHEVETIDTSHIIPPDESITFGNIGSKHIYELAMAARPKPD